MRCSCLIVGAGIIGSAIAYELSKRGLKDIHVIDPDLEGKLSSTERNAGGVRHFWEQPINRELSRCSISFFEKIGKEIGFQQTGYLWLYNQDQAAQGEALLERVKEEGLPYERLTVSQIRDRYPYIDKTDDLEFAILGAKDGLVNANALKIFYRDEAKKHGVIFHDKTALLSLSASPSHWNLNVGKFEADTSIESFLKLENHSSPIAENWEADKVVLAHGAWVSQLKLPQLAGGVLKAIRRQIAYFSAESLDLSPYGMTVDTSRVYFHPEGGNILAGFVLKDEPQGFNFKYDADFFETYIWPQLYERSSLFERLKLISGWAGLYSYTPDTSGILGEVPDAPGLYEAHSFTGRGLMQSYGAAVAIADLFTKGEFQQINANPLSRNRFVQQSPPLSETLHI